MSEELNRHTQKLIIEIQNAVYNPTRFIGSLAANGGDAQQTITEMLPPMSDPQEGFKKLAMKGRLDLSIEALVLYSQFANEFDDSVKAEARRRLRGSGITSAWEG